MDAGVGKLIDPVVTKPGEGKVAYIEITCGGDGAKHILEEHATITPSGPGLVKVM